MRRFDAEYLAATRRGMWADSRAGLADLRLAERESVLEVGCGTGEFTRVLREECPGRVLASDADPDLLASVSPPVLLADARRLPCRGDAVDLVVCQALLVNLAAPGEAIEEFARVGRSAVAVVEPDNGAVTVESTVEDESRLAARARRWYLEGVDSDPTIGPDATALFEEAGLEVVSTRRYDHVRTTEPPYSADGLEAARRMVTGEGLRGDRSEILAGETSESEFEALVSDWRAVGRTVVDQMNAGTYERRETVPFFVTVARV